MEEKLEVLTLLSNKIFADYLKNLINQEINGNITVLNFSEVIELVQHLKTNHNFVIALVLDVLSTKNVFDLIKAIKRDEDTNLIRIITVINEEINDKNFLYNIYTNGGHYFLNLKYAEEIEVKSVLENAINDGKRIKLLKKETLYDPLTMIFNRRGLVNGFKNMFHYTQAMMKENIIPIVFMVGILDIDNFKVINDTYGHRAGDIYLQNLTNLIEQNKRKQDVFGRYGGEEFCLGILVADIVSGIKVFNTIRESIANMKIIEKDAVISTTVSIGVTYAKLEDNSCLDVIQRADQALYIAKNKGKNRVEFKSDG
ncbi:hypothetical protein DESAMIL20_680 [Desulfurella amilsii]|uniref:diguanylate cyclase n=1 Tax=Desulfurella amilsii TaxID=1562698 RepID=A0A1X4XY74_9BACT|nr:GGDEF domain-containing protein [Desulfurella amilsii]OSS42496.1 hypothetical protein DESAMIL20_680 [Desulfurella amilsii]